MNWRLTSLLAKQLPGAKVERPPPPSPIVDEQAERGVRRRARIGDDALLAPISSVLAKDETASSIGHIASSTLTSSSPRAFAEEELGGSIATSVSS